MCVTQVKSVYHLNEDDIADLKYIAKRNPFYRCAPPMRLYRITDVEMAVARKIQNKENKIINKMNSKEDKKVIVKSFLKAEKTKDNLQPSSIELPKEILELIMIKLAESVELQGTRGPTIVARDIINTGLGCWDLQKAMSAGFKRLGEITEKENGLPQNYSKWENIVCDPCSYKVVELKEITRLFNTNVSGTKAELIIRLLQIFGLKKPKQDVDARCILSIMFERNSNINEVRDKIPLLYQLYKLNDNLIKNNCNVMSIRCDLYKLFPSICDIVNCITECQKEKAAAKAKAEAAKNRVVRNGILCKCGNMASPICPNKACVHCCSGCERHTQYIHTHYRNL